jgi:phosphoribosylamine--glycine ligase
VAIDPNDPAAVERFCRERAIDLVVVGPERPLAEGIVDRLRGAGFRCFGPTREAARLEGSKLRAKEFMRRHGVATAPSVPFGPGDDPSQVIDRLAGRLVVKYDGLAEGKGVFVTSSVDEARAAVEELRRRYGADAPFLIEERLTGSEISLLVVTDGKTVAPFPCCQDHKALLDGDRGPNTGGMGAFGPVGPMDPARIEGVMAAIVRPTLAGLAAERLDYRGVLYFGVMMTQDGPRLLEYNVRFGDPETQVILPLLVTDLADVMLACAEARLSDVPLTFRPLVAVDVVLASRGYPGKSDVGFEVTGLDRLLPETLVFHGGTRQDGQRLLTSGGRVLSVVTLGTTLDEAIGATYRECAKVSFEGMQLRRDIGRRAWTL